LLVDQIQQRSMVKLLARGDRVEVFSESQQEWMLDGEVVEVVKQRCTRDGLQLRPGSTKVVYGNGRRYKWLSPGMMDEIVRALPLPRLPEPLTGDLVLWTTAGWFRSKQERMYVELDRGFLQWWREEEDAKGGNAPVGSMHLLGSQQEASDIRIQLRADGGRGAVCEMEAGTAADASRWSKSLWEHVRFCTEERVRVNKPVASDGSDVVL
jgi:hypothetical protein